MATAKTTAKTPATPGITPEQKAALEAKLDAAHVKARKQGGRNVSYIEGWQAIAEANRIIGFDQWDRETVGTRVVVEKERQLKSGKGWQVSYVSTVRVTARFGDRVIMREGTGAGHGLDRDLGQAHESAVKEAETDAMKRALMTLGNPFGLALYDKDKTNVAEVGEPEVETISAKDAKAIAEQCVDLNVDMAKFKAFFKIEKIAELSKDQLTHVVAMLDAKRKQIAKAVADAEVEDEPEPGSFEADEDDETEGAIR